MYANITCDGTNSWNHSSASTEGIHTTQWIYTFLHSPLGIYPFLTEISCLEQGTNQNHAEVFSYQEEAETEASLPET